MSNLKTYKNSKVGKFVSIPSNFVKDFVDSLYFALNFTKLVSKPIDDVRKDEHYKKSTYEMKQKLDGVDINEPSLIAERLGINVEFFVPSSTKVMQFSDTASGKKRTAQLLRVKRDMYKPIRVNNGGAVGVRPQPLITQRSGPLRRVTNRNQPIIRRRRQKIHDGLSFRDVFNVKIIGEEFLLDADVNARLKNLIENDSISYDMIIAYLTFGTRPFGDHIIIERHDMPYEPTFRFTTESGVLSYNILSDSHSFIENSQIWIDLRQVEKNIKYITDDILVNYDAIMSLSKDRLFYVVDKQRTNMQNAGGLIGKMGKGLVGTRNKPKILNEELLSRPNESPSKGGLRHVCKVTYSKQKETNTVIVKLALDGVMNKYFNDEGNIYKIFKNEYTSFYDAKVIKYYGHGIVSKNQVKFDDGVESVFTFANEEYKGNTYIVLEFDPSLTTAGNLLRTNIKSQVPYLIYEVLSAHLEANRISKFCHGDLHSDNCLVSVKEDNSKFGMKIQAKLFDFDNSSIYSQKVFKNLNEGGIEFADVLINKDAYNNSYIRYFNDFKRHNSELFFEKYLWYIDAIRFCMALIWENYLETFDISDMNGLNDNREIAYVIESIIDIIPKNSRLVLINKWLSERWNKEQQGHDFVSAVVSTTERKMNNSNTGYTSKWMNDCAKCPVPWIYGT